MNKRNNYNSIVFLTTLSVYLGLVLVGGTPPVLAQAEITVQAKDKGIKKDSACNTFSSEAQNLFSNGFFVEPIKEFLKNFGKLSIDERFSNNKPYIESFRVEYDVQAVDGSIVGIFVKKDNFPFYDSYTRGFYAIPNNRIINLVAQLPDKKYRVTNFKSSIEKDATLQNTKFELTQNEFIAQISFEAISADQANQFANLFNETFALGKCRSNSQKATYKNTKAFSENNQVFIVTRLPRGSLDALLAKDAQ